jgi:hypothetical protein
MSHTTFELWCFLEDDTIFPVTISSGECIAALQNLIKVAKSNILKEVDASNLTIWKVRHF